ncbi:MAG: hypothetical protein IPL79_15075 [Myxococcales bacterium]|nr:hypothetical protein [Myxococcales bacterium]
MSNTFKLIAVSAALATVVSCSRPKAGETATTTADKATAQSTEHAPGEGHACGKHGAGHAHGDGEKHHGAMPDHVKNYHAVLSPIWHGTTARRTTACSKVGELVAAAKLFPAGTANQNEMAGAALQAKTDALQTTCASATVTDADFEVTFTAVHDAFHAAMEAAKP